LLLVADEQTNERKNKNGNECGKAILPQLSFGAFDGVLRTL